jgi:PST family polysaccharide transporter
VRIVIMLAATIVLARLISPGDYGLLAMVVAITGVAEIFRDFGLSMAALQARELSQHQMSNLFWINAGVGLALTFLLYVLSWPIASFYGQPELAEVVQAVSVVYFLDGLSTQFRVGINRSLRFVALAACDVLPPLVALGAAYFLAAQGHGIAGLVAQQIVTAVATLLTAVALGRWWPSLPSRGQDMGPLLSFGIRFAATQLLTYATRNVDRIAIGRVWGPGPVGYYDRAFQLAIAPLNQINVPMSRVAIPVLVQIIDDRPRYVSSLRQAQLIACYVTASGLFLIAGLGVPLVDLLLGPGWTLAGHILSFLAIGGVFRAIQQVSYWMFMSQGRADSQLRLHLVGQPLIIIAMLSGLPWGPIGVAIGNAVGYAIFWALALRWAGRISDINVGPLMGDALRVITFFGAPAGAAALCISLFVPLAPYWQIIIALGCALGWFCLCALVSRTVRRDAAVLFGFVRLALGANG